MHISVDIEIESPKNKVWAAITDIENCGDMITGIIDLDILHQPETGIIGLKWIETRKMFGKEATETMWITESKDEEYYYTRAESHGSIYITKMSVKDSGSNTLLTMDFSAESDSVFVKLLSAVMALFMKKPMIKMLNDDLEDIKKFVEKA